MRHDGGCYTFFLLVTFLFISSRQQFWLMVTGIRSGMHTLQWRRFHFNPPKCCPFLCSILDLPYTPLFTTANRQCYAARHAFTLLNIHIFAFVCNGGTELSFCYCIHIPILGFCGHFLVFPWHLRVLVDLDHARIAYLYIAT